MFHRTVIIIISFLILAGLGIRFIVRKSSSYQKEKEWFIDNLNYNFLLTVDSVATFNPNGNGFLVCSLDSGKLNLNTEDSLNLKLSSYKKLKFFRFTSAKEVRIFSGNTPSFQKGDRIHINSAKNVFNIYRGRSVIRRYKFDDAIAGQYF